MFMIRTTFWEEVLVAEVRVRMMEAWEAGAGW